MATTVARLQAVLAADTRDFDRAMDKSDSKMGGLAKTMGKAGVAGAVVGLGAAIKIGVGEFMEAQRVTAQTNAVLKSTGGISNTTTASVQKLSEALMRKSGVDDEAIQSGQNMLLTFTKIRNEQGKGNDVFNQATKATLDLSVAMGKDMQSSAVLVGKALNDPIKGIGALSRVGVQLNDDQKKLIKTMVATGDTAGAQKVILKELETQFGGSAAAAGKTFGGQMNIAKERMTNFAGEMVNKSIPVLLSFKKTIEEDVIPIIRRMWTWFNDNIIPILKKIGEIWAGTWAGIAAVLKEHEPELTRIKNLVQKIGELMLWWVQKVILPVLKPVLTKVLPDALGLGIDARGVGVQAIDKVISGFKWVIDNGGKVAGALNKLNPFGDPRDPNMTMPAGTAMGGINLMGANPIMAPFAAAAAQFGLGVTSGLRPGAITANGTPSDHGIGKALDVAGSAAGMAGFFKALLGNPAVKQAFYDPLGSIFGGAWSSYREGGHSDHVHVATYDKGGVLRPGLTMAYNGTGRNEYVSSGAPIMVAINLDGREFARAVFDPLKNENARQGRLGRGLT